MSYESPYPPEHKPHNFVAALTKKLLSSSIINNEKKINNIIE